MSMQNDASPDRPKGPIRLHTCRMGEEAGRQTPPNLLAHIVGGIGRCEALVNVDAKAFKITLQLRPDADSS